MDYEIDYSERCHDAAIHATPETNIVLLVPDLKKKKIRNRDHTFSDECFHISN